MMLALRFHSARARVHLWRVVVLATRGSWGMGEMVTGVKDMYRALGEMLR